MVIGMVIVYVFLIILMILTMLSARIFKAKNITSASTITSPKKIDSEILSVISEAIIKYRKKKGLK